jgi:putative zinc finger protein
MTSPSPGRAGRHAEEDLLASYAAGAVDPVARWSVETHLTGCAACRSALSAQVDAGRLARNRSALLIRVAVGDGGQARHLLGRCGIPDYLLRLLAATPSLRRSWLLSVLGVLAAVAGEAAAVRYGWISGGGRAGSAGYRDLVAVVPFLLVAPLLVLAGVAAAFLPRFDPAHQLAAAAPFSGFALLLVRTVCALAVALVPVVGAAFVLPGPGWLPAALLLPSLALCAFALAAATVMDPRAATVTAGVLWALPVVLLAQGHVPLAVVQRDAQSACATVIIASALVLLIRRDRFELGWTR